MAFHTSKEALEVLRASAQAATKSQLDLARLAKIRLRPETPRLVAAALLRLALSRELELQPRTELVDSDDEALVSLGIKLRGEANGMFSEEKWARIAQHWLEKRISAHAKLRLRAGDVVVLEDGDPGEVSSIGANGRVYFKGGAGFGAWPDRIKKVVRHEDDSAKAKRLREEAMNTASRRASPRLWSAARAAELASWQVETQLERSEVRRFSEIVETADDERPLQRFIEEHPRILASLIGGNERYCIPQKRLGDRFIPDFLLGSVDSLGIQWSVVELERPRSGIYLRDGATLDKFARKGTAQVIAWRKWIAENLSSARTRRSEGGLGLFDIEPHAPAFVIVGRRDHMPAAVTEEVRLEYRSRNNIEIHSYDWLLERLQGTLSYSGLPGLSPYLLSPAQPDQQRPGRLTRRDRS